MKHYNRFIATIERIRTCDRIPETENIILRNPLYLPDSPAKWLNYGPYSMEMYSDSFRSNYTESEIDYLFKADGYINFIITFEYYEDVNGEDVSEATLTKVKSLEDRVSYDFDKDIEFVFESVEQDLMEKHGDRYRGCSIYRFHLVPFELSPDEYVGGPHGEQA